MIRMQRNVLIIPILLLTLFLAACGGDSTPAPSGDGGAEATAVEEVVSSGDPVAGEAAYQSSCSACHGPDARGISGLGKDLVDSQFVHDLSDQELLEFVKVGRPVNDPANTTGVDMPPKGGNPALSDDQILDIIAYLRTLEE